MSLLQFSVHLKTLPLVVGCVIVSNLYHRYANYDPAQYMFPHEKFLFGYMASRPVPQELLFKESDYLRCKDFGQIYNELVNSAPTPYDGQAESKDA